MVQSGRCISSSDDVVVKSPNDKRLYRLIDLNNGLSALLVHDPQIFPDGPPLADEGDEDDEEDDEEEEDEEDEDEEEEEEGDDMEDEAGEGKDRPVGSQTKKAAAAMCVGMGSFSDPDDAQGLAHFLEHMLFMGSKEFPDENEYDSYLSKHGGSSNAYTETEHTCYHFEVKREFLKGALKRFSQFFVSPLVKKEAMEREVQAVDSEFNQVLQSDACRLQQLQCHTAVTGHPFNGFFWGNKKSLADAMEKGIDLRKQILKLYRNHYHGGLMKLVIIGGESLDVLQSWVVELFGDIKKGPRKNLEFRVEGPTWKPGKLYRLEAVKDVHTLDLTWTLPCLRPEYLKKPEDYIAHLLGHEGRGSLLWFFKAKGWATTLSAGVGDDGMSHSSVSYIFSMSIHLTDCGLEKIYEIIGFVYQYLKLMRQVSPQEWIFKELQDIGNIDFRFVEEQPQDDYAADLAANLLAYPAEHVIYGDYVYKTWDVELIKYVVGFFRPENMRIDVVSKSFNLEAGKVEPWFGSHYIEEDVSSSLMATWSDPLEIDASLHLPAKNDFIPSDFSIRADTESKDLENVDSPKCILDESYMKIWYKLDSNFKLPRANTYFRINWKGGYDNIRNCVLMELFINLLKDELNEVIYQASMAKLETSVSVLSDKLELKVGGFNDKLPALLYRLLETAKNFLASDDRFKVISEGMKRTLNNTNMKPLNHSTYARLQVLCESFYEVDEKLQILDQLSVTDLNAFIPELRSQLYVEGLCHGNLLEEEATAISNIFKIVFSAAQPLPYEMRHKELVVCLPDGANLVRNINVKNTMERNSVVELYYQIEQDLGVGSIKLKALIDLFDEIVEEPLFNQLRTKEQLGYVVQCGSRMTYRVLGFWFCVQSAEYNPIYLQDRVDNFINDVEELLEILDNDSFEHYKGGLMAKLLEKDPSLSYETSNLWGHIVDKRYIFDLSKKEAEELVSIEKSDVIKWYKTYLKKSSPKRRRLAVRVWGCKTDPKEAEFRTELEKVIDDLSVFKTSSRFYPSIC